MNQASAINTVIINQDHQVEAGKMKVSQKREVKLNGFQFKRVSSMPFSRKKGTHLYNQIQLSSYTPSPSESEEGKEFLKQKRENALNTFVERTSTSD